jgi:uncharacterized protein YcaQ
MMEYSLRSRGWIGWLKRNRTLLGEVEAVIEKEGPLGNIDFTRRNPPKRRVKAGWWSWKPATHALDYLWMSGRTMVHSRRHFQKVFDLAERVMPQVTGIVPPARAEFLRWHVRRSLRAMGAASYADLRLYMTFPRMGVAERRDTLKALIAAGEVVEIAVAGAPGPWYALAADLPALRRAGRRRVASQGTALLAPFDSLLWHRERTRRLFGFDYRIEVYTPGHKRVHGYYSLPIFHDGHLVGRLDAKNHRDKGWLEVRRVHFESWLVKGMPAPAARWGAVDRDAVLAGLADSLRSLAEFTGAGKITVGRVDPPGWKKALTAALG